MAFSPSYRGIWGVSYPLILAGMGESVVEVTDALFLAHFGVVELGAIGLAGTLYSIAMFIPLGLVDGIQITVGRRVGEGHAAAVGRAFNQGLMLLAMSALVMLVLIKLLVPPVTGLLLSSPAVQTAVDDYLQIAAYALIFHAFNLAYSTFYVGIARTRILIAATLVLATTNILLDYLLIFGVGGLPELGIRGAAIASLSAEVAVCLFLTADVLRRGYHRSHGLLRLSRWDAGLSRQLWRVSLPVSGETLVEMLRWFLFFVIIERLGEAALAQANIVYALLVLFMIPVDGLSEAVCSLVSNLIGQGRGRTLGALLRRTMVIGYALLGPLLLLALLAPDALLAPFTADPALLDGARAGLWALLPAMLLAVPGEAFYSALAGTGDTVAMLVIQVLMSACALLWAYSAALLLEWPLGAIWLAEAVGWAICLLAARAWLRAGRWRRLEI
jgi:putative MATE family efflux protein